MLACDSSIAPNDFASDKSYFGQLCLSRRGDLVKYVIASSSAEGIRFTRVCHALRFPRIR
jgi:hypothetical protein